MLQYKLPHGMDWHENDHGWGVRRGDKAVIVPNADGSYTVHPDERGWTADALRLAIFRNKQR